MSVPVAAALGATAALTATAVGNPQEIVFFTVTGNFNAVADPAVTGVVNQPPIQPISATVTFTPRLPKGQLLFISNYLVTLAYNAEQTLYLIGNPTSGTWACSFGDETATGLVWDITPANLQTALGNAISALSGNITVTVGASPLSYDVLFTGSLGLAPQPPLVGDGTGLISAEGAGFCEVTTTVTALGSPQVVADTGLAVPALTARIWNGVLSTIDYNDTPGYQLPANYDALNLDGDLIYDVSFDNVTFNGASQYLAPYAFTAPTGDTTVCLTDPDLVKLDYQIPDATVWAPSSGNDDAMFLTFNSGRRRHSWKRRTG